MLEILPFMGINAPKEHQRVIAKLTARLYGLYENGLISYEPFPEVMIDESKTSPTPDVLLYDNTLFRNLVIIEVAAAGFRKDFEKTVHLVDEYDVSEGFAYNYLNGQWRKYSREKGEIFDNPSFCDSIGYDLNPFVK